MEDSRIKKIRYRKKVQHSGEINGNAYKEYIYDWHKASISHIKRYHNCLMILMGIDGCERNLLDWLVDNMTDGNYVTNSEITRHSFMNFYKKWKKADKKEYAENTVKIAFQRLSAAGLLVQVTRGTYMVSPDYFFSSTDEARIRSIKMVMEFKSGLDTEVNVDVIEKK